MIKNILLICIASAVIAQEMDSTAIADSSFNLDPGPVLIKSVLFPGLGQVAQERLWESAFFYGMSFTYYYQAIIAYLDYQKSSKEKYLNRFRNKISVAAFIHILNIIDAYDSAYRLNVKGWDGEMFSDKPIKSPWGASMRSLIFPGWGQWYNEKYFKSALYLGLVSYVGYQVYKNNQDYKGADREIRKILRLPEDQRDTELLLKYRSDKKGFKDDRSRYSWYFGLCYLIMVTDAHVDAYLYKFDETVELSVPLTFNYDTPMIGVSISF
jgi:Family of unknown function (DUF5683)